MTIAQPVWEKRRLVELSRITMSAAPVNWAAFEPVDFFVSPYCSLVRLNEIPRYHMGDIESVAHNYMNSEVNADHLSGFVLVLLHMDSLLPWATIVGQGKHVVHFDGSIAGHRRDNHAGAAIPP